MNFEKVESKLKPSDGGKTATGENGAIAAAFPEATEAGIEILNKKGNSVDAACAAALALSVCEPQASGLGGQTMMLISRDKKVIAIDGSSRAPSLSHVGAVYKRDRSSGYRATTVPSTLATLGYVQREYGNLNWQQIVEPALRIATEGYRITELQHRLQKREIEKFRKIESQSGLDYFYNNGVPYQVGEIFKQPDLASLLKKIAEQGMEEFYTGTTAKRIDADMRENGGLLRADDLALIPWPIERKPLRGVFRDFTVYTMPPPGSGRSLLFCLALLNRLSPQDLNQNSFKRAHILAEIFRNVLLERSDRPFNANFYPQVNEKEMLSRSFTRKTIKKILSTAAPTLPIKETEDEYAGETTHLSVIDSKGMTVSLTQSIERVYGSKAAAQGLGFLYNNYMMDFEYKIIPHPYYLRPNAVPWATVAPSILFQNKEVWMALGSPGSERIISTLAQFLMHVIDEDMSLDEAMRQPRLHCSLGGRVSLEAQRFSQELSSSLKEKGYRIKERQPYAFFLGAVHAVMKCRSRKGFQAVAEVRRDGTAAGF
ncbi:MAG: gamma-glutamyltransferase [bacterium]